MRSKFVFERSVEDKVFGEKRFCTSGGMLLQRVSFAEAGVSGSRAPDSRIEETFLLLTGDTISSQRGGRNRFGSTLFFIASIRCSIRFLMLRLTFGTPGTDGAFGGIITESGELDNPGLASVPVIRLNPVGTSVSSLSSAATASGVQLHEKRTHTVRVSMKKSCFSTCFITIIFSYSTSFIHSPLPFNHAYFRIPVFLAVRTADII